MRQLTEEELRIVLEKLAKFVGSNLSQLVENKESPHVFRLHRDRLFYVAAGLVKYAVTIPRKQLISFGVCLGKFSKTKKFRLHVTALPYLARYAVNKVWLKPAGEQTFLYGNHVIKRHIARVSDDVLRNQGIVVFNPADVPLGFGVTAKSTAEMRSADTEAITVFTQADTGEYLRNEADLL